jgi:hypothetical protein
MTEQATSRHIDFARAAAVDTAGVNAVAGFAKAVDEGDGAFSYIFESNLEGYQGWHWSVTIFESEDGPTVSEVVLLPGENALLAPDWVPWSERLADWKALQAELEAQAALDALENEEESDDDDGDELEESEEESEYDEQDEPSETSAEEDLEAQVSSDEIDEDPVSASSDPEPSEDSENDSEDAGRKPPLFSRWSRRRNKGKKR